MTEYRGRCLCGKITFVAKGPINWSGICHCDSCRRATASPCTAFFGVARSGVTWTGDPAVNATSGGAVQRSYCADCGTQLTYQADIWPDETHLYMANLDDPMSVHPQAHYHWAERLQWLCVVDDLPKHDASADDTA